MTYDPERITYFAKTDFRNKKAPFGIKAKDRTRHMYVIGKTGMGKSTTLENMAVQDIRNGEGFAFMDPHGGTAEKLLEYIPPDRVNDVLYFAPFDMSHPISFNVMEDVGDEKRHLVANGLMSAFKKIWVDAWSARMEYILNNTILALLEYPGSTLISINRMFADKGYRNEVVSNVTDTAVKAFWTEEFAGYTDRFAAEATPAIQNKVGQFVSNPLVRNIIGQPNSSFDLREMMDSKKILIINLSKGRVGEDNANLLGSMLITKIYLAAMSRADVSPETMDRLPNFYLYVDEFQSFANESFANILSEARKYKLNLTLAHQYIEQMSDEVRAAVFGNVGTMIAFRVGAFDAEVLEKEFAPEFEAEDLVNLGFTQIYLKLMIDGVSSAPFSANTLPPLAMPENSLVKEVIEASRRQYSRPREEVETYIREWHERHFGGGSGKGGSGGGKGKKKGKDHKKAKEKALKEAISSAKDEEDLSLVDAIKKRKKRDKKSEKGPSKENLKKLEKTISKTKTGSDSDDSDENEDGEEEDSEGFTSLKNLAHKLSGGQGGQEGDADRERGVSDDRREGSDESQKTGEKEAEASGQKDSALSSLKGLMEKMISEPSEGESAGGGQKSGTQPGDSNQSESGGSNGGVSDESKKEITSEELKRVLEGREEDSK